MKMQAHCLRLTPGQDLKRELDALMANQQWSAACIITGIGSLSSVSIRYANVAQAVTLNEPLEIISLDGTLSCDGSHIHILVADGRGVSSGGHLKEGAVIRTTAEIVLGVLPNWNFSRRIDSATGFEELDIKRISDAPNDQTQESPD
jgi:predicted DNA-binding protein with PD1-like motif